jgi:hypothetical protein
METPAMHIFERLFGTRAPAELEARILPVLHMMAIDGKVHENEQAMLQAHLSRIGISRARAQELLGSVRSGSNFPLPTEIEHKIELLSITSMVMLCDGDVAPQELAFLFFLAQRMGIPAPVVQQTIDSSIEMLQSDHPEIDLRADFEAAKAVLIAAALARLRAT